MFLPKARPEAAWLWRRRTGSHNSFTLSFRHYHTQNSQMNTYKRGLTHWLGQSIGTTQHSQRFFGNICSCGFLSALCFRKSTLLLTAIPYLYWLQRFTSWPKSSLVLRSRLGVHVNTYLSSAFTCTIQQYTVWFVNVLYAVELYTSIRDV